MWDRLTLCAERAEFNDPFETFWVILQGLFTSQSFDWI